MNKRMFLYVKAFSYLGTMMDMIVLNAMVWVATGSTFWLAATMRPFYTFMQKSENHIRGRIFGISNLVISLGFGLGFVVAPFLLERFTMPPMVWFLHGCVITVTLLALMR